MRSLKQILVLEKFPELNFQPDFFQKSIEKNLYLEFFFSKTRALIYPDFKVVPMGPVAPEEEGEFTKLVKEGEEKLKNLRTQILYQLSLYSSLLETNSYYICLNNYLVICRFVSIEGKDAEYEIKLYTISPPALSGNYKEKLFLGRDLLSLSKIPRDYFGFPNIINFLSEQVKRLGQRCKDSLARKKFNETKSEYLDEIEELFGDTAVELEQLMKIFLHGSPRERFLLARFWN